MNDWQTKIGEVVRETYKRQGFSDMLIMIGGIAPNGDIHTQIWYPGNTEDGFDLRFMLFALQNHLFSEYNDVKNKLNE